MCKFEIDKIPTQSCSLEQHDVSKKKLSEKKLSENCVKLVMLIKA